MIKSLFTIWLLPFGTISLQYTLLHTYYIHYKFQKGPVASWIDLVQDPVQTEDVVQYAFANEGQITCDTMSRVCQYKHVNFAIATAKRSPLKWVFSLSEPIQQ